MEVVHSGAVVHSARVGVWRAVAVSGTVGGVNPVLRAMLDRNGGLVTRHATSQVLPRWVLEDASRSGRLLRVLPGVYVDAALADGRGARLRWPGSPRSWPGGRPWPTRVGVAR